MSKKTHLVVIDPQVDFCDPKGSLFVPGADADMTRLARFVVKSRTEIEQIHVTLDSHPRKHIAHPLFWKNPKGTNPNPFTLITADSVEAGDWVPADSRYFRHALGYVKALAKHGRYVLCIWPEHCLIGTKGHTVVPDLRDAVHQWEAGPRIVDWVAKGSNQGTEHYSAVQADVPDANDPSTQLNARFIDTLESADEVLLAGEALSHCVANTLRDILANFRKSVASKVVILTDASSNVPGFETLGNVFLADMKTAGVRTSTTADYNF